MTRTLLMAIVLVGCASSHSPDDAHSDSGVEPRADAGGTGVPGGGEPDADAGTRMPGPEDIIIEDAVPLTMEQAECLGLTEPACAGCHMVPPPHDAAGTFVLNPSWAGPPPEVIPPLPNPEEDCGL